MYVLLSLFDFHYYCRLHCVKCNLPLCIQNTVFLLYKAVHIRTTGFSASPSSSHEILHLMIYIQSCERKKLFSEAQKVNSDLNSHYFLHFKHSDYLYFVFQPNELFLF